MSVIAWSKFRALSLLCSLSICSPLIQAVSAETKSAEINKAEARQICLYSSSPGKYQQVNSLTEVPSEFRKSAKCFEANKSETLAKPEDIKLQGTLRVERINSALGQMELRWPRKVETLFGKTPLRAMTDAANTVSRALKNPALPVFIQNIDLPWQVVFMDDTELNSQIPLSLVANCHPGWMTPPANIYIVSQRVAGGCGGQKVATQVADSTLSQVLVHEMGHAVEFYLLKQRAPLDRVRAEGFATWFERFAAENSSLLNARQISEQQFFAAAQSVKNTPGVFTFSGSFEDYARASMYFTAISRPRGVSGISEVYAAMSDEGLDFFSAIKQELNWDEKRLNKEVKEAIERAR